MNGKTVAAVLLSGLLFACAQTPPPQAAAPAPAAPTEPAPAPAAEAPKGDRYVVIRRAQCEDLLRLDADDRAAASMFYIGYQASRFGSARINVSAIPATQAAALDYCTGAPNRTVASAFAAAYREMQR